MKAFFKRNEDELSLIIGLVIIATLITAVFVSPKLFLYIMIAVLALTIAAFIYFTLVRPLHIIYLRERKIRLEKEQTE